MKKGSRNPAAEWLQGF